MMAEENGCNGHGSLCQDERLQAHNEQFRVLFTESDKTREFRGQAKVVGIIAMVIWFGSFLYTFNHKMDARREHDQLRLSHQVTVREVSEVKGKLMLVEDRYLRLIGDIEKVHDRLSQLVSILAEDGKVQKIQIENYDEYTR